MHGLSTSAQKPTAYTSRPIKKLTNQKVPIVTANLSAKSSSNCSSFGNMAEGGTANNTSQPVFEFKTRNAFQTLQTEDKTIISRRPVVVTKAKKKEKVV